MRKDKKKKQQNTSIAPLAAAVLLALGVLFAVAYLGDWGSGALSSVATFAAYLVGKGAFLLPCLFFVCAGQLFVNGSLRFFNKITLLSLMVVLCLLGTAHHIFVPIKEELVPALLPQGGGIIGGVFALLLHRTVGEVGTWAVLAGLWLVFFAFVMPWKRIHTWLKAQLFGGDADAGEQPAKAARPQRETKKTAQVREPFFKRPAVPVQNADETVNKVNDIYGNSDFNAFTDGIKEKSSFRSIFDFKNKNVYEQEPVKQQLEQDPVQLPEWQDDERRTNVVLRPRIDYDAVPVQQDAAENPELDAWEQELEQQEQSFERKLEIVKPKSSVIRNDYRAQESGSGAYIYVPSAVRQEPVAPATEQTAQEDAVAATTGSATTETAAPAAVVTPSAPAGAEQGSAQEKAQAAQQIAIYDSADKIGSELQNTNAANTASEQPVGSVYKLPPLDLLDAPQHSDPASYQQDIMEQCAVLEQTLADFRVRAKVIAVTRGPSVTRFELEPAPGVKVSSVVNLADDIALRLAAPGVRIEAPIPGKSAIGIEAPNTKNDMVCFREVVDNENVRKAASRLCIGLGKDISGNIISADLAKMPHLLVAGSTGSGKSVCINTIIAGLLYKARPEEVKLILVDPKVVELSNYNGIPHLLTPVVTEPKKAASALHWAVAEMERRYKMFADNNVRNIETYNMKAEEKMPFIVIIIDELSDLMMVAKVDVEDAILRLAQKARAAGIHLILATQRPSVDVITGIVKANIPSRIAFAVSSQTDSRTIIDMGGAEKLLGKGDMLFYPIGMNKPVRVQGAFVTDAELNDIVDFIVKQSIPVNYTEEVTEQELASDAKNTAAEESSNSAPAEDELFEDALALVLDMGQASSSMLQRRFRIGYTRAARLVDTMEELGIVGQSVGSKPREVIMSRQEAEERFLKHE